MLKERQQFSTRLVCPGCGQEYFLDEIFFFDDLAKKDYEAKYICDECDTAFKVRVNILFCTEVDSVRETVRKPIPIEMLLDTNLDLPEDDNVEDIDME